ncbi:MAG TPA: hypothetical protein VER08_00795 [Pyrinomonadaceae bacterium]|nr:hypothetical protein [Pyrinomonadaceae bacterium]
METNDREDRGSVDAIVRALYETISGPAGQERDLRRFRALFINGARLIRTETLDDGRAQAVVLDLEEYLRAATSYFRQHGFYESEVARKVDTFGNVVHVFSTYESRHSADDPEPFARGINSIQLFKDGGRYQVVTILWDFERPDNPIPPEYLQ